MAGAVAPHTRPTRQGVRPHNKGLDIHQKTREKIRGTAIAKRLQAHVLGEIELSATQIRAAEILLRKVVPDLAPISPDGKAVGNTVVQVLFGYKEPEPIEAEIVEP